MSLPLSYLIMLLQMSSSEDSYISDTSSEGSQVYNMVVVAVLIARLKAAVANVAPVVNPALPFPKMSGWQWMQLNLQNEQKCKENLRCLLMLSYICTTFYLSMD